MNKNFKGSEIGQVSSFLKKNTDILISKAYSSGENIKSNLHLCFSS